MFRQSSAFFLIIVAPLLRAENPAPAESAAPVELEPVEVYSPRVANQDPAVAFAMPVTALRYEPLVDVQARNLAEGQADVSIRGGTFENTGFSIGALPIYDPQTGHYFAELPVAPEMLGAPEIRTGADNAISGWNATAGSIAYVWRPILRTGGSVSAGFGDNALARGEVYSSYVADKKLAGRTLAADVDIAGSEGDGSRSGGDHEFELYNARLQLRDDASQTDVFAGYQSKYFGWPNLYAASSAATPLRPEYDDLHTRLFVINHRANLGADGDYFQAGTYYRGNRDHYEIPKLIVVAGSYNAYHETIVRGAGFDGRISVLEHTALRYRAGVAGDDLDSTSLIYGRYMSRTQVYAGLYADETVELAGDRSLVFTAGSGYDAATHGGAAAAPVAEAAWLAGRGMLQKLYGSYAVSTQLPTYTALNSNPSAGLFRGNPNLKRSRAENFEVGAVSDVRSWTVRTAVFLRRDDDLVDWTYLASTPNARVATAVDVDTLGFEATSARHFGAVDLVFGYTFMDKHDDLAANRSSFYALNYAEHRLTAAITARLGGGFEARMDNEARIQAENALRRGDDQVVLSSLGLYYQVPGVKNLTLSAQVDNLWNTYYEEVPLVPGARREWSVGARYGW